MQTLLSHRQKAQRNVTRADEKYIDEVGGTSTPGTSGMAGSGPLAAADEEVLHMDERLLSAVQAEFRHARKSAAALVLVVSADTAAARSVQPGGAAKASLALILGGTALLMLMPLGRRRRSVRLASSGTARAQWARWDLPSRGSRTGRGP